MIVKLCNEDANACNPSKQSMELLRNTKGFCAKLLGHLYLRSLEESFLHTTNRPPAFSPESPNKRLWGLLTLGILIHLGFGWLLTFSVDEAHYAYYAVKLDWSYFDHPPLVGWVQWPLVALGAPDGLIRIVPESLWFISCLLARQLAYEIATLVPDWNVPRLRESAGLWAIGLVLLAPLMHVLAVGLLPDTLLMTLTLALMLVTLRLIPPIASAAGSTNLRAKPAGSISLWCLLGFLLGLAGLSKYTAVLPATAIILIVSWRFGWAVLWQPGPWLAVMIAAFMVLPVFYWNAQHDWISFSYQINHGAGGKWRATRLAAFTGIQIAAYGPLLILGSVAGVRQVLKNRAWIAGGFLLFFFIPFAVTAFLAGGGGSLPHWTAPAWLAITPFAANALAQRWHQGRHRLIRALIWIQGVICVLAFAVLFFAGIPSISQQHTWGKKNPIADLWGWETAGDIARQLAQKHKIPSISVSNWTLASRLAWYARPTPVYVLDNRFDQFDLWFGQIPAGSDSLFVNWSQMRFDLPTQAGRFESCTQLQTFEFNRLGRVISDFGFYHCRNWGAIGAPSDTGKTR